MSEIGYQPLPGDDPILDLLLFGAPGVWFILMSVFDVGIGNVHEVSPLVSLHLSSALRYFQLGFGWFLLILPFWVHSYFWFRSDDEVLE